MNLEGRYIMVADIEELETMDASEIVAKRLNAKEVIFAKRLNAKEVIFPMKKEHSYTQSQMDE